MPLATEEGKCKAHTDIYQLWLKILNLRWVLVDEISMVSAQLLHLFLERLRGATREPNTYKVSGADKSVRLGGGYNFLFFGDWCQIAPVPGTPLFRVPAPGMSTHLQAIIVESAKGDFAFLPWFIDDIGLAPLGRFGVRNPGDSFFGISTLGGAQVLGSRVVGLTTHVRGAP